MFDGYDRTRWVHTSQLLAALANGALTRKPSTDDRLWEPREFNVYLQEEIQTTSAGKGLEGFFADFDPK